jgi:hypothetical protein
VCSNQDGVVGENWYGWDFVPANPDTGVMSGEDPVKNGEWVGSKDHSLGAENEDYTDTGSGVQCQATDKSALG